VYSVHGIVSRYRIQHGRSGLWLSFGLGRSEATRGLSRSPVGWGLHQGWLLLVTAWLPAGREGLLRLGSCLRGPVDPMDPMLNLAVSLLFRGWAIAWWEQYDPISGQYTWAGVVDMCFLLLLSRTFSTQYLLGIFRGLLMDPCCGLILWAAQTAHPNRKRNETKRLPIGNHTLGIQWSHDRWRHVNRKFGDGADNSFHGTYFLLS